MVELKSCGNLVNDSAFSAIDQEVKEDAAPSVVNATIAEISVELEREREKNALLMQRISELEAQLQAQQNQSSFTIAQGSSLNATERRSVKRFKRQILGSNYTVIQENVVCSEIISQQNQESQCNPPNDQANVVARQLVNWISMDHETRFLQTDHRSKDEDLVSELNNTDDSDEEYNLVETSSDGKKTVRTTQEPKEAAKLVGVRKPPKMPFCPKEVKRMLESEILKSKNAQTHTIRKIIVFASLGIRHGCDDMYELDFSHFSIQKDGEPYVLYENPGVQRKMFFPNHQNPILCPVKILEEEKSMRLNDPSCPSCFFLCIKYGGSTRNLPQNEYVRQRMGRNKLKSLGPEMCRMGMLVHIRSGSFFFKALGITLLFMAGFPAELVQRETKYKNLELLQKYYRTDEDAEGEELFHSHPLIRDTQTILGHQNETGKLVSTKSKGKKQAKTDHKSAKASVHQIIASTSTSPTQFGEVGYASVHQSQTVTNNLTTNFCYNNQNPYHVFHPQPPNAYMPILYWSPPNPYSYPSYISLHPQPYYSHPSLVPRMLENNNAAATVSGSDSSSSNTLPFSK